MGLILEPKGVDLIVGGVKLTPQDQQEISAAIAEFRRTGKLPVVVGKTEIKPKPKRARTPKVR